MCRENQRTLQQTLRDVKNAQTAILVSGTNTQAIAAAAAAGDSRGLPNNWRTVPMERLREAAALPQLVQDMSDILRSIACAPELANRETFTIQISTDARTSMPVCSHRTRCPVLESLH